MDAALLNELEQEHREVEQIFADLDKAEGEEEQRRLVDQLETALNHHMEVEETEVYPALAEIDGEMEEEAETEHGLGREGIAKLRQLIGQPGFGAAVAMCQAGIAHHVEEEENEVFPKLRDELGLGGADKTKDELYEMAKAQGVEGRSSMTKDELEQAVTK